MVTARAAGAVAGSTVLGAIPVLAGADPWTVLAAIVAIAVVTIAIDRALAADPGALAVYRAPLGPVRLGERTDTELTVHNRDDGVGHLLIRDAWVPSAGATPLAHEVELPAGQYAVCTTTLQPTRRGDRAAVRVTIRSHGPLGLAFRQAQHNPGGTLRVLPRFESRKHLPEKLAKLRIVEGATTIRGRGQSTELDTLREYVPGDDVRSIDWRATARRQDVTLRLWRPERSRRVLAVIDTGRTSAVQVGDSSGSPHTRLDFALEASLLLAAVAQEAGDQVDLLAADHQVRAAVSRVQGRNLLPRLVNALAPLQPGLVETDFELIIGEVLRRERKRSLVVVFTALEPGALGEGLLPILPQLVAKHQVVIAAVHDPVLAALAQTVPGDADAVYARAAGIRALADRRKIASALARHGVTVLDSPAHLFASDVTDAYLALKAAGKL